MKSFAFSVLLFLVWGSFSVLRGQSLLERFRPTSVSGFPRLWLNIRMPCLDYRLVPPDVRFSRIRRSHMPSGGLRER